MYNDSQQYELSFESPRRRPRTKPRIVFATKAAYLDEINRRMCILTRAWTDYANEYCYPGVIFTPPVRDLFGNLEFGYGRCGVVSITDDEARFQIELAKDPQLHCATLTMKMLAHVLAVPIDQDKSSNQVQQVDLEIRCDRHDPCGYNHAVGGYMSSRMTAWLQKKGREVPQGDNSVSMPQEVIAAMRTAWCAVIPDDGRKWARECRGGIMADGRFMLKCFGDACDLAIYPDLASGMSEDQYVRFGCHNLDTAAQQVTLIAGLAKLCELARKDE